MNKHDHQIAAKDSARTIIEALTGYSVQAALDSIALLELGITNGSTFHPRDVQEMMELVKGLPSGSALQAARLARDVILNKTQVDASAEHTALMFTLWSKEAALVGAGLAA